MLRIALTLATVLLILPSHAHADITGKPRVVDGDTIHIGKTKIRLHGIDAPEMKQTCKTSKGKEQMCGVLAKQALERLVRGQDVTCKGDKRDRYKRLEPSKRLQSPKRWTFNRIGNAGSFRRSCRMVIICVEPPSITIIHHNRHPVK